MSESEILMTTKSKKIKKELSLSLLDDIIQYIEKNGMFNNNINFDNNENMIPLTKLTNLVFGATEKFIIEKPVIYKCSYTEIMRIRGIILDGDRPEPLNFNVDAEAPSVVVNMPLTSAKMVPLDSNITVAFKEWHLLQRIDHVVNSLFIFCKLFMP